MSTSHPLYDEMKLLGMRAKQLGKILTRLGNTPVGVGIKIKKEGPPIVGGLPNEYLLVGSYVLDMAFEADPRIVVLLIKQEVVDPKHPIQQLVKPMPSRLWVPDGYRP